MAPEMSGRTSTAGVPALRVRSPGCSGGGEPARAEDGLGEDAPVFLEAESAPVHTDETRPNQPERVAWRPYTSTPP